MNDSDWNDYISEWNPVFNYESDEYFDNPISLAEYMESNNLPVDIEELTLDDRFSEFRGIEKLTNLKKLTIKKDISDDNEEDLCSPNLVSTIEELTVELDDETYDLWWATGFDNLRELRLKVGEGFRDYDFLSASNLVNNLQKLILFTEVRFESCQVFSQYKNLEWLALGDLHGADFEGFAAKPLSGSLSRLELYGALNDTDYSFLEGLRLEKFVCDDELILCDDISLFGKMPLKHLDLRLSHSIKDLSPLKGLSDLAYLGLSNVKDQDLRCLASLPSLAKLWLWQCDRDEFEWMQGSRLEDMLEELGLGQCSEFRDLEIFKNFSRLKRLSFETVRIPDIRCILDYECVRNGSLQCLYLPDTVNWTDIRNGNVVFDLREKGIEVETPSFIPGISETKFSPKLYIILGPSCAGKSTLIDYVKELGCNNLQKISDRASRLDDDLDQIVLISKDEFKERADEGEIVAVHEFHKALYGVGYLELIEAKSSRENYFLDSCDPFSALRLRDVYPDFVKLVLLDVPGEVVEARMRERELLEYDAGDIEKTAKNMQQRRYALPEEFAKFRAFKNDMDYVIEDNPFKEIKKIIGGIDE